MQTICIHVPCVQSIVLFCTIPFRGFSVTLLSWWEDKLKQGINYSSIKDKSSENWQQSREFPQPEQALWGHLRGWLGWRNPKDGPIFFHYQLRDCGVTPSWSSSIRCQKCGGVRLCHCASMWRWGRHSWAVHRAPSSGAGEGLRWDCRRRGLRTVFDIREEAAVMSMDLPGMNYAVHPLAVATKKIWPTQGSFPGLGKAAKQLGLWTPKGCIYRETWTHLKSMGIFFMDFSGSRTSPSVCAFCVLYIKNKLSVLLAGANVQGNGGRVLWYCHGKWTWCWNVNILSVNNWFLIDISKYAYYRWEYYIHDSSIIWCAMPVYMS